jgi:hypothetical protein
MYQVRLLLLLLLVVVLAAGNWKATNAEEARLSSWQTNRAVEADMLIPHHVTSMPRGKRAGNFLNL